jgi:hypothetical protein
MSWNDERARIYHISQGEARHIMSESHDEVAMYKNGHMTNRALNLILYSRLQPLDKWG